jgi:lysophospholipase L1-like esterase
VKNIDPKDCIGYSNAFLMCGTNDLRCEAVKNRQDVHNVVEELRQKISEIKQLCPNTKIFVVPVLPSRIPNMNSNIRLYNELVDQMLSSCFPDVWFQGIYSFLDQQGLLSARLARPGDKIHLGSKGLSRLVTYIKVNVFKREKYESPKSGRNQVSPIKQVSTQEVGSPEPT